MRRFLIAFCFCSFPILAHAWNAAGHRLVAVIAWQQLSPAGQKFFAEVLGRHPDHERWVKKGHSAEAADIFAEAATWPDDIRHDPRFYDPGREPPTPSLPGLADTARHKRWHYMDLDRNGKVQAGELDGRIEELSRLLVTARQNDQLTSALPWLLHLVADIHQPLHVGRHGDEGGNDFEIENPFNKRLPFSSLHTYWDDLPGPPWLRGKRLEKNAQRLMADFPAPQQGDVVLWRDESHRLLARAYPKTEGSLLPMISEEFHQQSRAIANRRLVEAGYRLGRLLETIYQTRVSRETP
ncbi:S1/P1 nuclease [Dechloromonas sp. A34]|uniref:S1/P1 nuclease n=1 Tax=Dechloromonas sp. A34 TaxID=447588 RepID=UPI002249A0D8|nr:S1/P1 nuclease [Dechloromonas sp. A34]